MFGKVLGNLSCRYKIGLTATPKRADGMSKAMFALIGDVVHEVTREEVAGTTCPVDVRQMDTGYMPNMDVALCGDGTINFAGLISDLTQNVPRLNFVLDIIKNIPDGSPALILANRVNYLQALARKCGRESVCLSGMGTSKKAKQERKDALAALNAGEIDCLFATYQLAAEGLDCPNLRYVVFATPEKNERIVAQASGRVARKADGKEKGTVIDLVDDFGMLYGWAKKRRNIYVKKLEFSILE
jgi:superfamily II DNA or RNA helicase